MAIAKMNRLRLLGMKSDRAAILRALQRLGCVQITEPEEKDGEPLLSLPPPDGRKAEQLRTQQQNLRRCAGLAPWYCAGCWFVHIGSL